MLTAGRAELPGDGPCPGSRHEVLIRCLAKEVFTIASVRCSVRPAGNAVVEVVFSSKSLVKNRHQTVQQPPATSNGNVRLFILRCWQSESESTDREFPRENGAGSVEYRFTIACRSSCGCCHRPEDPSTFWQAFRTALQITSSSRRQSALFCPRRVRTALPGNAGESISR